MDIDTDVDYSSKDMSFKKQKNLDGFLKGGWNCFCLLKVKNSFVFEVDVHFCSRLLSSKPTIQVR